MTSAILINWCWHVKKLHTLRGWSLANGVLSLLMLLRKSSWHFTGSMRLSSIMTEDLNICEYMWIYTLISKAEYICGAGIASSQITGTANHKWSLVCLTAVGLCATLFTWGSTALAKVTIWRDICCCVWSNKEVKTFNHWYMCLLYIIFLRDMFPQIQTDR